MKTSLSTLVAILLLTFGSVNALDSNPVCKTRRNAPPSNSYYWPPNSTVKVYFVRNMFTPEQRQTLSAAMVAWSEAATKVGADVKFVDAGESDNVTNCKSCLTVTRREVYKSDSETLRILLSVTARPERPAGLSLDRPKP